MKGVIWKIEGRKSIVLFQNGDFRAIPTPPDAQTGMAITFSYNRKRIFLFMAALCAAAAAAVWAAALYFSPAGYIDVIYEQAEEDRRIIVEMSINRFDRILETRIFSAEAAFSESLPELKHKDIDEGYANTLKAASLMPAASNVRLQITHRDMGQARILKARFTRITAAIEEMTGRKLALNFQIDQLLRESQKKPAGP